MSFRRSQHEGQQAATTTRYAGARLTANPGGVSAAPQAARVGAFVQGLLAARGSCARAADVARLFREIEGGNPNSAAPLNPAEEAALSRLVADANAALEPMQLAVKRVTLPEPAAVRGGGGRGGAAATINENDGNENDENGEKEEEENAQQQQQQQRPGNAAAAASLAGARARSYYGVVNVEPDAVALAHGWGLSPALLAYLRAVLERMVRSSDTPCCSVPQEALLSIDHAADAVAAASAAAQRAAAAALDGGGGDEGDEGGEEAGRQRASAAAAAAARAATATQPPPPLKRSERGAALQALADCGWLSKLSSPPPGGGGARRGSLSSSSSRGGSVSYGIGPRSFMELGELLRSFDPAPEVLEAWAAQL